MSRASSARGSARAQVAGTRRLVAHVPWDRGEPDVSYGPADGDPVDLPAPCIRLLAGYWCPCGGSFIGTAAWEVVHFARVVPVDGGAAPRYVDDRENGYEAPVPLVSEEARAALFAQVEALPVGTVVERHGIGLARRFDDVREAALVAAAGPEEEPWAW